MPILVLPQGPGASRLIIHDGVGVVRHPVHPVDAPLEQKFLFARPELLGRIGAIGKAEVPLGVRHLPPLMFRPLDGVSDHLQGPFSGAGLQVGAGGRVLPSHSLPFPVKNDLQRVIAFGGAVLALLII